MNKHSTLRLLFPQWQGGLNPLHYLGAGLLSKIVPENHLQETIEIPVSTCFSDPLDVKNGVSGCDMLLEQLDAALSVLEERDPERIIVFGGDCAVSHAPMDFLSGKYGDDFGILWLDAHPDISTTVQSSHFHEMVLGNLTGHSAPPFSSRLTHPVSEDRVMYAGLIERELRDIDSGVIERNLRRADPKDLKNGNSPVVDWIKDSGIRHLAIHFDLDVLSPAVFNSNSCGKPGQTPEEYGAAIGELTLSQISSLFHDLETCTDIVCLCIAEYYPWDAINLRNLLGDMSLFQN